MGAYVAKLQSTVKDGLTYTSKVNSKKFSDGLGKRARVRKKKVEKLMLIFLIYGTMYDGTMLSKRDEEYFQLSKSDIIKTDFKREVPDKQLYFILIDNCFWA